MTLRDRVKEIRRVRAGDLIAHEMNPRRHSDFQRRSLQAAVDRDGFAVPPIAFERDGQLVLIDGHLRVQTVNPDAMLPVVVLDVNEAEARDLLLTVDPLAELASYDAEGLQALIATVEDADADMQAFLDDLAKREAQTVRSGLTDPDAMPGVAEPISKPGDLWLLGEHRLLCGDATKAEDVERLMGVERAALLFTDPPYGVIFGSARKNAISGDLSQAEIPISFAVAVDHALDEDARLYLCGGSGNVTMYAKLFDYHLHQQPHIIVWVKDSFVMRPNNYHSRYELVYFGWKGKGGDSSRWFGDRKQSDVWEVDRDRNGLHPTEKPVALCEIAIGNSCPPQGLVYEPFSGSGTTIIAADRLGRRCHAIEIEPRYVDVAVKRWQEYTGRTAEKA